MSRRFLWRCLTASLLTSGLLVAARGFAQDANLRPKYGPAAVRLFRDREFVRTQAAPDFWALLPYYVSQPDAQSCSAASVAMLVNALRAEHELTADQPLATPASVVEKVEPMLWKAKLTPEGEGVSLDELAMILGRVLPAYGSPAPRVEIVRFENVDEQSQSRLRRLLTDNEQSSRDLVLVNFLQSAATGDPEGAVGHIAPIGAYDAQTRRVLIFDPDRQWYEPYWITEETLLKAMTTADPISGRMRGLVHVARTELKRN